MLYKTQNGLIVSVAPLRVTSAPTIHSSHKLPGAGRGAVVRPVRGHPQPAQPGRLADRPHALVGQWPIPEHPAGAEPAAGAGELARLGPTAAALLAAGGV